MMMKGDIPIPSQIVEIIGEKNVADIYDGDSSDDSSVEVWKTNVKACSAEYYKNYSSKRTPARQRKRRVILNQLKVFQSFYVAQKGAQRKKESNEGESGYDSRGKSDSQKSTTRSKAAMPRATTLKSPSSQSDMFSTCSPVKEGGSNDSTPKKKVVRRRETLRKDIMTKSSDSSSSEEDCESERVQRLKPHSDAKESDSENSNDSDSSSNTSDNTSEKSPSSRLKKEEQNDLDVFNSVVELKDDKKDDSIVKGTVTSRNSDVDNPLKTISNKEVKDPSPQNQKTFKKNVIPGSSTLKKDSESETSSSEDDSKSRVEPRINISPFVTAPKNNTMVSEQPSVRKSDNSDSENDSDTSQENEIPDHKQPPNLNSKHSNDANSSSSSSESESEKPRRPSPKKEVQSESGSDDSDSTSRGPVLRGPLPSGNEPSSDSYQSEHEIIPATQELSGRFTSLANISTKRDTSGSDQDRLVGASKSSKLRSPSKQPKNPKLSDKEVDKKSSLTVLPVLKSSEGNVSSNYTDSEDDKVTLTNKPSSQYATIRQAQSSSSSDDSDSDHKGVDNSRKSVKETSLQGTPTESIPHRNDSQITRTNVTSFSNSPKAPIGGLPSKLKVERNNDSSSTSDSSDSEQEESANAKSLLSLNNHQDSLPQGKESRKNCHSDSKDNVRQQSPTKGLVGNNPRKRKADSISSSDGSDNEHKNKVRKIISPPENVPFNSTRNPEVDETSFPGSDISVIPKIKGSSTAMNYQGTMDNQETPRSLPSKSPSAPATKDPGSQFQKPGQLSIREFARPISTASLTTSQDNYETLKQEYFDAGYSNLKERYDFESYEGLLEEDLLDNDNEVYVVQCPREVDPMTLVGKEIDVSSKESVVELRVAGGQVVLHDIYCDLSDSEFGINVVVPSRNKKKFTLNTVPVNGRLTIVESVEVPQIDEFDISSPPRIPLPDNLRARNSFVGSDESTAQSISGKSKENKSRKARKGESQGSSSFISNEKYDPIIKREISEEKLENRDNINTNGGKLDDRKVHDVAVEESSVKKQKKKKKKHELEELSDVPEHTVEKKKEEKKKKKEKHEYYEMNGAIESEQAVEGHMLLDVKEEPLRLPTDILDEGPNVGEKKKKKKKKKKCDLEELSGATESEQAMVEHMLQDVKEEPLHLPTDVQDEEPKVEGKKKKKKRHLEELSGSFEAPQVIKEKFPPPVDEPPKKKKKKHHVDEHTSGDVLNSDDDLTRKKKKKKIKREKQMDED